MGASASWPFRRLAVGCLLAALAAAFCTDPALAALRWAARANGRSLPRVRTQRRGAGPERSGDLWGSPAPRYDFPEERRCRVGAWVGLEQLGSLPKPTAQPSAAASQRRFFRLRGLVGADEVERILACAEGHTAFETGPDAVDHMPTYEYSPMRRGRWLDDRMRQALEGVIESRILPYVRERYDCRTCTLSDVLVRRYVPGERRTHSAHFDSHAFVTAVLGLSDPDGYDGGFYVQQGAGAASRLFPRIEPGDLVSHASDLMHGVHVWRGVRHSLILWFKDSPRSVLQETTPWYDEAAKRGDADAQYSLAANYARGINGKKRDPKAARQLYEQSARAGHHLAQNNLGVLYQELAVAAEQAGLAGSVVDALLQKSVAWFRAAAASGFAPAQRSLAALYTHGSGVEADTAQAATWLRCAAEQLDVYAAHRLGELLLEQAEATGAGPGEAVEWLRRSADAGLEAAQRRVAELT